MTPKANQSSRVPTAKPRSVGGILGGVLGIVAMSAIAGVLVTAAVTPVVAVSGAAATSMINIFEQLPSNLNPGQLAQPTVLYAKQGDEKVKFAEFFEQNREPVGWNDISQYVKDAAVAVEDPRFYSHGGVDALAAGRAAVGQVLNIGDSGASTITMQYVRNVLVQESTAITDPELREEAWNNAMRQDMDRKLKEMRLAISVEKQNTKDDILLGYLNIALFGGQVYGIESAANYYYGVSANDLTLPQAASLVGIVNEPARLQIDVEENIPANEARRNLILTRMLEHGKITQEQYDEAVATPVEPKITPRVKGCAAAESTHGLGHFCDYVQRQLKKDSHFGEDAVEREFNVARGGYEIMTTIDLDMQRAAVEAMRANVAPTMEGIEVGAASVSTEVNTGRVLAMTQNRPYSNDDSLKPQGYTSINYNTDYEDGGSSGFQVGSTFKPVTLTQWIKDGRSVRDIVNASGRDVPYNSIRASCLGGVYAPSGTWKVNNDNLGVQGNQSVLTVMGQSLNGGVISMQQRMDLCDTFETAKKLGMHRAAPLPGTEGLSKDEQYALQVLPSNVYGGVDEMSPLTMALSYGAFSGGGKVCTPVAIDSITGPDGEAVAFDKSTCSEAISPEVAAGVAYALQYAVTNGLARHAISPFGVPHLAKTGTTENYWDNWTVGGSSKVTTATWVGNVQAYCWSDGNCDKVDTRNYGGYYGLTAADTRIWPAVMNVADQKYGGEGFGDPSASALKETRVQVPDVKGMSFDEAKQTLEAADFTVTDGGEVDSSEPNGTIARTDPEAGSTVSAGAGITLYRSNGKAGKIPDGLQGVSGRDAERALRSAGFSSVGFTCSGDGSPDPNENPVTSVSPGSGSEAKFNTKVTLTLKCDD